MTKKVVVSLYFALSVFVGGCFAGHGTNESDKLALRPIVIAIVGDSTVTDYPPEGELRGWGQMIPEFFNDNIKIKNFAKSGTSSKSFIKEGLWSEVLKANAEYIMIQFGHNDCPGKGDRTTDPNSDYQEYLRKYIADCRKLGIQPILVTPMERRNFDEKGKIRQSLAEYSAAMKKVGEIEKVPVIDLHDRSVELYELIGPKGCSYMDLTINKTDHTHFSEEGAITMAKLVISEINKKMIILNKHLVEN